MPKPVKSIANVIDAQFYGGKAAWLSRLRKAGLQVPDAVVFPACTVATFEQIQLNYLNTKKIQKLLHDFCDTNNTYRVSIRSSATIEDGTTESLAGHFESCLGQFTLDELLKRLRAIYLHGFSVLRQRQGMMAVIVQRLVDPSFAGVCFSANPLSSCRDEMIVSFTQGLAGDLVGGKIAGSEFIINRKNKQTIAGSVPSTFPFAIACKLEKDICKLESLYKQPLDIEWCLDHNNVLQYIQCRPIASLVPNKGGLLPVKKSFQSDFPVVVTNNDKVAIRLLCEEHGIFISNAYLHTVFADLKKHEPDLSQLATSPDCVSFSTVLVFPRRLEGNIIRHFAKNDTTRKICSDRRCIRYTLRELSTHPDLKTKVKKIHQAALASHWLSIVIIQEIFEPKFTGVMMRVDRGVLIEIAYGHFVPKGVVPTSYYLLADSYKILEQKEVYQEVAYLIDNGAAVSHRVAKVVSASPAVLTAIVKEFAPLLKEKSRALEFGVLETKERTLKPYLIDLVDVSPESDISSSLLGSGVLSQGVFVGKIVDIPPDFLNLDSLHEHLHSHHTTDQLLETPIIYRASRPDIGLLRLVSSVTCGRIALVFDEGSLLSHLAIILREKRIPAIINPESRNIKEGTMVKLDATSEHLSPTQRLTPIEQRFVFSYPNPDADGVISSLAFNHLKASIGEDYRPVCFGVIDHETEFILQLCGLNAPPIVNSINANHWFALVDTHHIDQLPKGIVPKYVCEIIDHHPGGNPEAFVNAKMRNEKVGAVCTLLAEDMRLTSKNPPIGLAKAMALAIVSNTLNFSAPSTTPRDHAAFAWLCGVAPVTPEEINKMLQARSEFTGRDQYETLQLNSKKFVLAGRSVLLVQIEAVDVETLFDNQLTQENLSRLKAKEGVVYAAVSLVDPIKRKTVILAADSETRTVLNHALNLDFQDGRAEVARILLRKTDFIPQLETYFSSH